MERPVLPSAHSVKVSEGISMTAAMHPTSHDIVVPWQGQQRGLKIIAQWPNKCSQLVPGLEDREMGMPPDTGTDLSFEEQEDLQSTLAGH